jgi:hypothetical protein
MPPRKKSSGVRASGKHKPGTRTRKAGYQGKSNWDARSSRQISADKAMAEQERGTSKLQRAKTYSGFVRNTTMLSDLGVVSGDKVGRVKYYLTRTQERISNQFRADKPELDICED